VRRSEICSDEREEEKGSIGSYYLERGEKGEETRRFEGPRTTSSQIMLYSTNSLTQSQKRYASPLKGTEEKIES